MKRVSWYFNLSALVCAVLLPACQDEEKSTAKSGDVRFAIRSRSMGSAAGGKMASVSPETGTLHITVLSGAGDVVFDLKEVALVQLGDYLVTEPVTLSPGEYTLAQFIITEASGNAYVAPLEGSPVAEWVDDPLPIPFTVQNDEATHVDVQILPFDDEYFTPEDFGYISFGVEVVPYPHFRLAVFNPGPDGPVLVPVQAYVLDGADTLFNKALSAGTHHVAFVGKGHKVYTLVLKDETYGVYAQSFLLDGLLATLQGEPWTVTMKPAVTIASDDSYGGEGSGFHIEGHGTVFVDWGDGTREEYNTIDRAEATHTYDSHKQRVVTITGDLESVSSLVIHSWAGIQALHLDHLPSLREIGIVTQNPSPRALDLRKNTGIMKIEVPGSDFRSIDLPQDSRVGWVDITSATFTVGGLSDLVHAVHTAAVSGGLHGGELRLARRFNDYIAGFVAPPSAQTLEELRTLRDAYQWTIEPSDF